MSIEISLRKAIKLRSKINNLIKSLSTKVLPIAPRNRYDTGPTQTRREISVYTPTDEIRNFLNTQRTVSLSNMEKIRDLYGAAYGLRVLVNQANSTSGVSDQLALASQLEALIDFYKTILNVETFASIENSMCVAIGHQKRISTAPITTVPQSQADNTISLPIFLESDKDELQARVDEYTLTLSGIHDKIEYLNSTTMIVLPDAIVKTLTSAKLI